MVRWVTAGALRQKDSSPRIRARGRMVSEDAEDADEKLAVAAGVRKTFSLLLPSSRRRP